MNQHAPIDVHAHYFPQDFLDLIAKRVQLLKETVPGLSRVAVLVNPGDPGDARRYVEEAHTAAASLGICAFVAYATDAGFVPVKSGARLSRKAVSASLASAERT